MRELNQKDVVMLDNVIRMLKQVQFRGLDFDEALAVSQTYSWLQGFRQECQHEVNHLAQQKKLQEAMAQAKEVKSPESLPEQAPVETKAQKIKRAKASGGGMNPEGQ